MVNAQPLTISKYGNVQPGDNILIKGFFRINNTHLYFYTFKDYKTSILLANSGQIKKTNRQGDLTKRVEKYLYNVA